MHAVISVPTFGELSLGQTGLCVIDGVEYRCRKIRPFPLPNAQRNAVRWMNAFLLPRHKIIHGSGGLLAVLPDSTALSAANEAA